MRASFFKLNRTTLACVVFAQCAVGTVLVAFSQEQAAPTKAAEVPAIETTRHSRVRVEECERCHSGKKAPKFTDDEQQVSLQRVRMDEANQFDRHNAAGVALLSRVSEGIGKLLAVDVKHDVRCLSCHSPGSLQMDGKSRVEEAFDSLLREGVSCQACHGPAKDWLAPHDEKDWWIKDPIEKAQLGMRSLRDPVTRAETCTSCHVGDISQGRLVTHDMYAAGHPSLRGFEIENYDRAMTHAMSMREKPPEFLTVLGVEPNDLHISRGVVVGNLVAKRRTIELYAEASAQSGSEWPEFALYSCTGCHHELTTPISQAVTPFSQPEWTNIRRPGRPMPPFWPFALSRFQVGAGDWQNDPAAIKELIGTLQQQPFGNPESVGETARRLVKQYDTQIAQLSQPDQWREPAQALGILRSICESGQGASQDIDSARQLAASFTAVLSDVPESKLTQKEALQKLLGDLNDELLYQIERPKGKPASRADLLKTPAGYAREEKISKAYVATDFRERLKKLQSLLPTDSTNKLPAPSGKKPQPKKD